ncbi:DMT family transporter [Thaumasiovibrio subtropicus]|uniref:DMT family transporter n=1 Tax=Thaumasiovibrio subtropicus TaxID=1891207 RepID=UPI000B363C97|nr:DMT family transporter [Thaumasiovibrio subtropicus]
MLRTKGFEMLALLGGGLLALMIFINSQLAAQTSALHASWLAHGIGGITAWGLLAGIRLVKRSDTVLPARAERRVPLLCYLGGIPGAMTVMLAAITVNSALGLSGTLVLGLAAQMVFTLVSEQRGWFGIAKQQISFSQVTALFLVILGAAILIYAR